MKNHPLCSLVWVAVFLAVSVPVSVEAAWTLKPRVFAEAQYDDNVFLSERDEQDDFVTTIAPGIHVAHEGPTDDLNLDYQFKHSFFRDDNELDYSAHRGQLDARKDLNQWFGIGLREAIIRSEDPVELTGLVTFERPSFRRGERFPYTRNILQPDAVFRFGEGRFVRFQYRYNLLRNEDEGFADQDTQFFAGTIGYRFTVRHAVEMFLQHSNWDYGETIPPEPSRDGDGNEVRGRYTYSINPRTDVFASYRFRQRTFDEESRGFFDFMVHDPRAGFSYDILENLSFSASAGYAFRTAEDRDQEGNFSGRFDLNGEYRRLALDVYGETGMDDDLWTAEVLGFYEFWRTGFRLLYPFLEKLLGEGYFYIERDDFKDIDRADRILSGRASLTYEVLRWLFCSVDYQYLERSSSEFLESFEENRFFGRITVEYDLLERKAQELEPRKSTR